MSPIPDNYDEGSGGDREPITGCLIHRVTKYREYKDACLRFSLPVLSFRKDICHHANRNSPLMSLAAAQYVTGQRKCHHFQCA